MRPALSTCTVPRCDGHPGPVRIWHGPEPRSANNATHSTSISLITTARQVFDGISAATIGEGDTAGMSPGGDQGLDTLTITLRVVPAQLPTRRLAAARHRLIVTCRALRFPGRGRIQRVQD